MYRCLPAALLLALAGLPAPAADWPTAGADARRTGYVAEDLAGPLSLRWSYQPQHAPMPAWPHSDRPAYDRGPQPVIAGGTRYFGSSADGQVYALDAARPRMSTAPCWRRPSNRTCSCWVISRPRSSCQCSYLNQAWIALVPRE